MALVNCAECGKEISDSAKSCPHCGYENQKQEVPTSTQQSKSESGRSMGFWLGAGIFLFPVIFSWFTLRNGYSKVARGVSFSWLGLIVLLMMSGDPNDSAVSSDAVASDISEDTADAPAQPASASPELIVVRAWPGGPDEDSYLALIQSARESKCRAQWSAVKAVIERQEMLVDEQAERAEEGYRMGMTDSQLRTWQPFKFIQTELEMNSEILLTGKDTKAFEACLEDYYVENGYLVFVEERDWEEYTRSQQQL